MKGHRRHLPLVYSCSGCSSAAQTANDVALALDREGAAEMSCIAGVGGGVAPLVRLATSGRPILAIDGCALNCVKACLAQHGVAADIHMQLADLGVKKRYRTCPDPENVTATLLRARAAAEALRNKSPDRVPFPHCDRGEGTAPTAAGVGTAA